MFMFTPRFPLFKLFCCACSQAQRSAAGLTLPRLAKVTEEPKEDRAEGNWVRGVATVAFSGHTPGTRNVVEPKVAFSKEEFFNCRICLFLFLELGTQKIKARNIQPRDKFAVFAAFYL